MLPGFLIEEIRRREEERRREPLQPALELPRPAPPPEPKQAPDDEPQRGVIVIEL